MAAGFAATEFDYALMHRGQKQIGLYPFGGDFYVPANCRLPQRSNETPADISKGSELSMFAKNHEEANLVCFMDFVNPNFSCLGL
jgi:hypothetical protein